MKRTASFSNSAPIQRRSNFYREWIDSVIQKERKARDIIDNAQTFSGAMTVLATHKVHKALFCTVSDSAFLKTWSHSLPYGMRS